MPNDYSYYYNLGISYLNRGDNEKAVENLKDALDLDPKQPLGWLNLSTAYYQMGKINESIDATRQIMKFHPNIKDRDDLIKYIFSLMGDQDKLREMCENAIENPLEFKGDWSFVGTYFLSAEEYDKSINAYKHNMDLNPNTAMVYLNLCIVLAKKEEYNKAIEYCKKALELDPSLKYAWIHLGLATLEKGDTELALMACNKALEIDPLLNDAIELKAKIQEKLGKKIQDDNDDPIEVYQGQELRRSQKSVLVEIEKSIGKPLPPVVQIRLSDYRSSFGFMSKSGYVIGLGLEFGGIIPESIGRLKYLKYLSIAHTFHPKGLPENIVKLQYLEELKYQHYIIGASQHRSPTSIILNKKICQIKSLKKINIEDTYSVTELPECLGNMPNLQEINVTNCHNLTTIPKSIKKNFEMKNTGNKEFYIRKTKEFEESDMLIAEEEEEADVEDYYYEHKMLRREKNVLEALDSIIKKPIPKFDKLDERKTGFVLKNDRLIELSLFRIKEFDRLPSNISNLKALRVLSLNWLRSLDSLPESLDQLQSLKELRFQRCDALTTLPESIGNLESLESVFIKDCKRMSLPNKFKNLKNLKQLIINIIDTANFFPEGMEKLQSLQILKVQFNSSPTFPQWIGKLTRLQELTLEDFNRVSSIEPIKNLLNLEKLQLSGFNSVNNLEPLSGLVSIKQLKLNGFISIESLSGSLNKLSSLEVIHISNFPKLKDLTSNFQNLINLKEFVLNNDYIFIRPSC